MKLPRIVLLRPRNADNLGSIARAMKNFGLTDWRIVSPNPELLDAPGLNRLAVKAFDVVERVQLVASLAEAVADCTWVVGTTMRQIPGRKRLLPKEVAQEASDLGDAPWALVFGDERSGLENSDLLQCHALSFIPASEEQPSLNLAQAVMVYIYEVAMAARNSRPAPGPILATDSELREVRQALELSLKHHGFLNDEGDGRHAVDEMVATLIRSRLTRSEARLWKAAFRVVAKSPPQENG